MWFTLKIFGIVILDLTIGLADRDKAGSDGWISNTGGSFELSPDDQEEEWDGEEGEYDPEYDNTAGKTPPFGFMHA